MKDIFFNREIIHNQSEGDPQIRASNTITIVDMLAEPIIIYSAETLYWTQTGKKKMDVETTKLFTIYCAMHPRSSIPKLYLYQDWREEETPTKHGVGMEPSW